MFELKPFLDGVRRRVDEMLRHYLGGSALPISQAMTYSVMAGGKRLRPALCIAAAETVGGDRESVLPMACAIELIHTYSLVHDDLPAMDNDEKRRGKPTCHVQFGEATAILAGDALLTRAFEIAAIAGMQSADNHQQHWLMAIAALAAASGYQGMIEGQMRDMAFEGRLLPEGELETLHRLKTGKMIEVSVDCGALLSGAASSARQALQRYAQNLGLAFQVADDILNVKGDPQRLGKATGTDCMRRKNTYPSLLGLSGAERLAGRLVDNALQALAPFAAEADPLRALARYVIERNR